MKIVLTNRELGLHRLTISEDSNGMQLLELGNLTGKINADITLDRRSDDLTVKCDITATAELACSRCLDVKTRDIKANFSLLFTSESMGSESPSVRYMKKNATEINLHEDVRGAILLSLPIKVLCQDDCKGLCSNCGTNLNKKDCGCTIVQTDPRWDKLKEIQA